MSLQATPARSSRITKPRRKSAVAALGLKRKTSSPSTATPKRLSLPSETSTTYDDDEPLDDTGVIASLANDLNFRDVPQYMEYIRNTMFSSMPEKGGMNSTRIAQVLNFRRRLPPFVTIAHLDALSTSATRIEREIAELTRAGILRRVTIPHRGVGAAAVGDGIASVREWQRLIEEHDGVPDDVKAKYISALHTHPASPSIPGTLFTPPDLRILLTTGFLTAAAPLSPSPSLPSAPGPSSLAAVSTSGARHASGSVLAAASDKAATQHKHGGTAWLAGPPQTAHYHFSLPNMGTLMKLLVDARAHVLALLKRTTHGELPLSVLAERWDGAVRPADDVRAERKKLRGEFAGVVAGRTKKWKVFYGLRFEWVVRECVGAGLVELFETRSVGTAVRLVAS